jgi:hypothetical protein
MAEEVSPGAKPASKRRGLLRSFWDFLVLSTGISTQSNLTRTQGRPVRQSGLFLFRKPKEKDPDREHDGQ